MTDVTTAYVVDASVGIKLFVPEELSEEVQNLFEDRLSAPENCLFVPDLFFIECANVLWKKVQREGYPLESAKANLADLKALDLPSVPTFELVERAVDIASSYSITAYDACYIALSEMLGTPLLTADERLVSRFSVSPFTVLSLQDKV